MRSSRLASAQWMSSKTRIVGCSRAALSRNCARRAEERLAICAPRRRRRARRSRRGARRRASGSASRAGEQLLRPLAQLRGHHLRRVALEDAGELHQLRRQRAVGAALAIRQRPAPHDAAPRRPPRSRANSPASVDLPTPAGPKIETRCGSRSRVAQLPERAQDRQLALPADDRGDRERPLARLRHARSTATHAWTGCSLPFATTGSVGSYPIASRVSR